MGREYVHPFAEKDFRKTPLFKDFEKNIKEPWDNKRAALRNKDGNIIPNTSYRYFLDTYDKKILAADIAEIKRIQSDENYEEKTPLGEMGEYLLMDGIERLHWLSREVKVFPAHEFDDIKNGTDIVACFESDDGNSFYLAIDVTTSQHPIRIKDKRRKILDNLIGGNLAELKYFEDQNCQVNGNDTVLKGKKIMPRIAVVLDPGDVEIMVEVLLKKKKRGTLSRQERENLSPEEKAIIEDEDKRIKLVQHSVEKEFIDQVKANMKFAADLLDEQQDKVAQKVIKPEDIKRYAAAYEAYKIVYDQIKKEA